MKKVSGYLTEKGKFYEKEEDCVADEMIGEIMRHLNGYGQASSTEGTLAQAITERYEIRRKDGA